MKTGARVLLITYLLLMALPSSFTLLNPSLDWSRGMNVALAWAILVSLVAAGCLIVSPRFGARLALASQLPQAVGFATPVTGYYLSTGIIWTVGMRQDGPFAKFEFTGGSWAGWIGSIESHAGRFAIVANLAALLGSALSLYCLRKYPGQPVPES